jgi:HAD superfamily hydrolase (TIGR01509 family)
MGFSIMSVKLVIFDLDGVLIDSRGIHFDALNMALHNLDPKYTISMEEHLSTYDGLSTTKKLELLEKNKGLPKTSFNSVWKNKQKYTEELYENIMEDDFLIDVMKSIIREAGVYIAVASNSITATMIQALNRKGLLPFVDFTISNENVMRPKPFPEMYWSCMTHFGVLPKETIIIEDSHIGRKAALDSGAHLLPVQNPCDVTKDLILKEIRKLNSQNKTKYSAIPWIDHKLNVVIPMAGGGTRFKNAGYTFPKPLIEVHGKPMIQLVVENLNIEANYTFIVQKEHYEQYHLYGVLEQIVPGCKIVQVDGVTDGAARTILLSKSIIDNDNPLLIVNSDQFIEWNSNEVMYAFSADKIDGGIVTFKSTHPKWSYAKLDENGFVSEVAEKNPISDNATVGIYLWKKGSDFVKYAEDMIDKNIRVNNEFYVAPVFNQAVADGRKFRIKEITRMWGLGTPEDLNYYLQNYKDDKNDNH